MDVLYFLKERTKFIRYFYDAAQKPFRDTIGRIEASEPPFDKPPGHENIDGEPPFMEEWSDANTALNILGRTCVSMLSSTLQLYFKTWESELRVTCRSEERKRIFKKEGFVQGYKACFSDVLKLSWSDCPANIELLEQVVLARNRDQHPDRITSMGVKHSKGDWEKRTRLHFLDETAKVIANDPEMATIAWLIPEVHVSRETLFAAIEQAEVLSEWLEPPLVAARYSQ